MTERTPWWKAFLKRKSTKDSLGPDFDPFAPKQREPAAASSKGPGDPPPPPPQPQHESNNSSSLLSDETYDDSRLESVFNEQTCRRNMKVSRSGRFKERRRVRSSLPIQEKETEHGASGKEEIR